MKYSVNIKTGLSYIRKKRKLFEDNADDICVENLKTLHYLLIIVLLMFSGLLICSLLFPPFYHVQMLYLSTLFSAVIIFVFSKKIRNGSIALIGLYILFISCFSFAIYISVFINPCYTGSSIVGMFCLMPLLIIDKSWRINLFMVLGYLAHATLCLIYKPLSTAQSDVLTTLCFAIIGILIGEYVRMIKLKNYDLKRQACLREQTDSLTNLSNRRKMFDAIAQSEKEHNSHQITGIMMIDIDRFKLFNDSYGHQMGDQCLKKVAYCLKRFEKEYNISSYRYGGEEFMCITYDYSYEELKKIASELNKAITDLNIPHHLSDLGVVTACVGFSVYNHNSKHQISYEELINQADKALYYAKNTGRNKVSGYIEGKFAKQQESYQYYI